MRSNWVGGSCGQTAGVELNGAPRTVDVRGAGDGRPGGHGGARGGGEVRSLGVALQVEALHVGIKLTHNPYPIAFQTHNL
jgi:hypothetical protein